jgi:hypothetical protein
VTCLSPKSQLLFFLFFGDFFGCELLARDFALVEACEVFFARSGVEFDFLGRRDGDFAFLYGRRHDCECSKLGSLGSL